MGWVYLYLRIYIEHGHEKIALFSSPGDAPKNAKVGSNGFARGMQWVIGVGFNGHTFAPAAQKALPILIKCSHSSSVIIFKYVATNGLFAKTLGSIIKK